MKKILTFISQFILASGGVLSVSACNNPLIGNSGNNGENKPDPPITKDIAYYQALIKETKTFISECQEWIGEIREDWANDKDHDITDQEYQLELDQVTAEMYLYQAQVNEYQYQILLLEKEGEKFTLAQIIAGLTIIQEKITNLEIQLGLKEKYQCDYPKEERQAIRNEIEAAKKIQAMFIKLKEEEENKCEN